MQASEDEERKVLCRCYHGMDATDKEEVCGMVGWDEMRRDEIEWKAGYYPEENDPGIIDTLECYHWP